MCIVLLCGVPVAPGSGVLHALVKSGVMGSVAACILDLV
jgi:hypothetical protein